MPLYGARAYIHAPALIESSETANQPLAEGLNPLRFGETILSVRINLPQLFGPCSSEEVDTDFCFPRCYQAVSAKDSADMYSNCVRQM